MTAQDIGDLLGVGPVEMQVQLAERPDRGGIIYDFPARAALYDDLR